MLMSVLATVIDPIARSLLYLCAILECRAPNNTAAGVAPARHQEFRDVSSLMTLSNALIENNDLETGLLRAKEALELAIQGETLVNYAAGHLVRLSVKTGAVETVNKAMEALIDSTEVPRKGDCVLETDWCDKAEALGADIELISWIRSVAKTQMAHMKRRKRRLAPKSRAKHEIGEYFQPSNDSLQTLMIPIAGRLSGRHVILHSRLRLMTLFEDRNRKLSQAEIDLPLVRIEASQSSRHVSSCGKNALLTA